MTVAGVSMTMPSGITAAVMTLAVVLVVLAAEEVASKTIFCTSWLSDIVGDFRIHVG